MARKTFTLTRNKDKTVTFRSDKYIESFSLEGKGLAQTYDRVKFSAICAGIPLSEDMLQDLIREAMDLHE